MGHKPRAAAVQDVCVGLCGLDAGVPELLPDRSDIGPAFEEVRGERPEGVAGHVPVDPGPPDGLPDRSCHHGLVAVIPTSNAGSRVDAVMSPDATARPAGIATLAHIPRAPQTR